MSQPKSNQGNVYHIRLKGILKHPVVDWLGDIKISPQKNGETLLTGWFPDQPALRGILDQLWDLNFTVLSVYRVEDENHQDPVP